MESKNNWPQPNFELRKALIAQFHNKLVSYNNNILKNIYPDNRYFPHFLYGEDVETGEMVTIKLEDDRLPAVIEDKKTGKLVLHTPGVVEAEIVDVKQSQGIDSKLIDSGFDPEVVKKIRQLAEKIKLPKNANILFLGPGVTPLQFLLAGDRNSIEVIEKSADARQKILDTSRRLNIESSVKVLEENNSDLAYATLGRERYDAIFALNILDLVGENRDVYIKILHAIKDKGKIAIGHFDIGIGTREQNNLSLHAESLKYGIEDQKIIVDEGHSKTDRWYSSDSTLFKIYKKDIPQSAQGKELSNLADILKLFASLK